MILHSQIYKPDYEKVNVMYQQKRQILFRKFVSKLKISLGSEKLITIFALAKRIRV